MRDTKRQPLAHAFPRRLRRTDLNATDARGAPAPSAPACAAPVSETFFLTVTPLILPASEFHHT